MQRIIEEGESENIWERYQISARTFNRSVCPAAVGWALSALLPVGWRENNLSTSFCLVSILAIAPWLQSQGAQGSSWVLVCPVLHLAPDFWPAGAPCWGPLPGQLEEAPSRRWIASIWRPQNAFTSVISLSESPAAFMPWLEVTLVKLQ